MRRPYEAEAGWGPALRRPCQPQARPCIRAVRMWHFRCFAARLTTRAVPTLSVCSSIHTVQGARPVRDVLDVGAATGLSSLALLAAFPGAQVTGGYQTCCLAHRGLLCNLAGGGVAAALRRRWHQCSCCIRRAVLVAGSAVCVPQRLPIHSCAD